MGGGALTHTFKPTDTLVDVNQHILMNQEGPNHPFLLMTNFPKKVFSADDTRKTLKELGNHIWWKHAWAVSVFTFRMHTNILSRMILAPRKSACLIDFVL